MGMGRGVLRDLISLKRAGALDGCRSVVEIGAQQIADSLIDAPELPELFALFGKDVLRIDPIGQQNFADHAPPGRLLWSALGFVSQSIDVAGGSIFIDLNDGRVPRRYRRAFDLVVNAGTTEHVANQGNAFAAIHDLVRVGGVMYHELPSLGNVDHGLVGYQPKFFHRLAQQNRYKWVHFDFCPEGADALPDYLQPSAIDAVPRTTLRIAFVKERDSAFSIPVDG